MSTDTGAEQQPRFSKPKILTVDLPRPVAERLRAAGYNVLPGTFGRPYRVKKDDIFVPVIVKASVPNYGEQEVIVIDLTPPETVEKPEGEKHASMGELDWFVKANVGVIDPRPRTMTWLRDDSDRSLLSGGMFVVFAQPRVRQKTVLAAVDYTFMPDSRVRNDIEEDNWSSCPSSPWTTWRPTPTTGPRSR
jgi:hypothetical protein